MLYRFAAAAIATFTIFLPAVSYADGCYLCQGGGYVAFTGDDSFTKRREAKEKFACVVQGTTSECSRPKGSVSAASKPPEGMSLTFLDRIVIRRSCLAISTSHSQS